MLHEPVERVRERAERLAALVGGEVEDTVARVGGGALPLAELPSAACAVEEELAEPLRLGEPPVIAVVRDGRTLLDCRTLSRRRGRRGRAAAVAPRDDASSAGRGGPRERSRDSASASSVTFPDWFGIEDGDCRVHPDVAELPTFAIGDDALLSLKLHTPRAAEVYVMGVRRARHGQGLGTVAARWPPRSTSRARDVEYLQVKTLGPFVSRRRATRGRVRFYEARGFVPLEELHGLWEHNPCLLLVKRL